MVNKESIERMASDTEFQAQAKSFLERTCEYRYSYNFTWLGRPIIQYPQDMMAMQELIWSVRPDLIVETGIAHGGSLIFYASMLELVASCGGNANARIVGIDIDIRAHNRLEIENHPLARRITMIEGSSIDPRIIEQVRSLAGDVGKVMVCLDSNHTHDHVLSELEAYAPLTSLSSYCVVFDTVVEDLPKGLFPDRPWGPGNNPKTAVREFLKSHSEFENDETVENKLLITVAAGGYLKRVR
jgi:cephalosporin hydroxylase